MSLDRLEGTGDKVVDLLDGNSMKTRFQVGGINNIWHTTHESNVG